MKNTILTIMGICSILAGSCKNNQVENNDVDGAMTDTVASAPAASAPAGNGGLNGAMNEMMDRVHALKKKGIADYDLAAEMREHHRGAIAMAEVQLDAGSDPQLKQMAQKIKDKQQKEADKLSAMLDKFGKMDQDYDPTAKDKGLGKAMSDNMMAMMEMPKMDAESVDGSFAAMMVKHHQDGIRMGKAILEFAKDAEFKQMAQMMISDQQKEIAELQNWQQQHK